ncbi:hypothetical protein BCR36DRAFT_579735 [Piromyces finnis]|uniref:PH-domain-containing protein n=1 Tax=Piromyces finnis TaxID=1754191 RepID=A0A1Y1VKW0_9FUNG|nr:hypothetical protein BCR36DRAFT_579735 [Piromyces finnis]|eukprot:ORX59110.1 hypothetical protein BCR36DRAFT_579735 [Piromyces finnis]
MTKETKPLIIFGKHPFEREEEDEIEFQTGDPILVLEKDEEFNDGWWKGRTLSGDEGLFPVNFTTTENIFNVNINKFFENGYSYVPNIIEDNYNNHLMVSPFGTFNNSLSLNNSQDGIHRSFSKSGESTNSSGFDNRPSSPEGSVSSMKPLSSPRVSTSLPNNFRTMGGDLDRITSNDIRIKSNNSYNNSQPMSYSQPNIYFQSSIHTQSQQSTVSLPKNISVVVGQVNQVRKPQDWSVNEVCEWLMSIAYEKIIPAIKENNITGDKLLDLNLSKLREYGINSLSERIELLHEILTLREEYSENKSLFSNFNRNSTSYVSDYESINSSSIKYDKEDNKMHKSSSNFSISEYYDKSDMEYDEGKKIPKSNSSNESVNFNTGLEKRHHELPVTPNVYKPSELSNTSINNGYGGMTGISGITMGSMGNRNRSLSLQGENHQSGIMPVNQLPRSMSISTSDKYKNANGNNLDFKNAERKGWLSVRFDDEVEWKKRWVVLIDNKLYILKSPDSDDESSVNISESKVLLILELDATYKILPDSNSDNAVKHNFLLKDPRLGSIHLAAEDQLGVVTWINVLVRACTNTIRKPLPLIPIKNTGRQTREPMLGNQSASTIAYESKSNYPTIYENQTMDFTPKRKNSVNMSINGILSPNMESEYAYSVKNDEDSSFLMDKSSIYSKSMSNSNTPNPMSPISPTQTAAAAANGWYRTNAKSATDYSNYRNLQHVSQETRVKLQKTAKLTEPPVMTPILKANKVKSFNPNKIEEEEEFSLNDSGMMSFLSGSGEFGNKKSYMGMNSMNITSPVMMNKHNSVNSSFIGGYNNYNHSFGVTSQVSPIEMMERRGIGSFITNNQTKKMNKSSKKNSILFW